MAELKGLEFCLSKRVGKAITDYGMLAEGDRIAVGVSGGKDSLSLLRLLRIRQAFCPVSYRLFPVHVDLGYGLKIVKGLRNYFKRLGYEYAIKRWSAPRGEKNCFWCSWNRRKILFETAAELKCNKVALGHNLDDVIQTILLNLFFNSEISAMSPRQELFGGRLTIIRPLVYVQESETRRFARQKELPYHKSRCRNSLNSNRRRVAGIIKDLERVCPSIKTNILRSVKRIKKEYLL